MMVQWAAWGGMPLRQRFMLVVGLGVVVLVSFPVIMIARFEERAIERKRHQTRVDEMTKRPQGPEDIGVSVFNSRFDSRNSIGSVVKTLRSMDKISSAMATAVREQQTAADIDDVTTQAGLASDSIIHFAKSSAHSCAGTIRMMWCPKSLATMVDDQLIEAAQFLHSASNADKGNSVELF